MIVPWKTSWLVALLLIAILSGALWWADAPRVYEPVGYTTWYDRVLGGQP